MNKGTNISRRSLLSAAALGASGLLIPSTALGDSLNTNPKESSEKNTDIFQEIMSPDDYLDALIVRSGDFPGESGSWQTCTMDADGNIVVLKNYSSVEESIELATEENVLSWIRESGIKTPEISTPEITPNSTVGSAIGVVGGLILGYLFGVVIDGIVTAATGESTAYWFAQAIKKTLWRPFPVTGKVYINCYLYADPAIQLNCRFGIITS